MGCWGLKSNDAVGFWLTTTLEATVLVAPRSSVTFRRTVWGPGVGNERDTVAVVPSLKTPLSSRSHASEAIVPSGSLEVEWKETLWPTSGAAGENVNWATGTWLAGMVTDRLVLAVFATGSASSVTARLMLCGPGVVKVWVRLAVAPVSWTVPSTVHLLSTMAFPGSAADVDVKVTA